MKFRIHMILMVMAAFVLAGGTAAYASRDVAIATVKTPFMVGDRMMPAGTYDVEVTSIGAILLQAENTAIDSPLVMAIARTPMPRSLDNPQLVFDRVGNTLKLAQVRLPDEQGYLLMEPPAHASPATATTHRG